MPRKSTLTPEERKERRREYQHNYYMQHKEYFNRYKREWIARLPSEEREKQLAFNRAKYAANKDKHAKYRAARWAAMTEEEREAQRARARAWSKNNPERRRVTQRAWQDRHREQINARRRAKYAANHDRTAQNEE